MLYRLLNRFALSFAAAGLAISSALTLAHTSKTPLPCGGGNGCDLVAQDPSSYLLGIPVSVFGLVAYSVIAVISFLRIWNPEIKGAYAAGLLLSGVGAFVSSWLTYHSITAIHATCVWCLASAAMMFLLTITYLLMRGKSDQSGSKFKPFSEFPWVAVPFLLVGGIAYFGDKTKPLVVIDLSTVDLSRVSLAELDSTSHSLGDVTAPIVIAEFGDLMCPACRDMHPRVLKFRERFPSAIRLLFHHFPLSSEFGHELSVKAAEMSEQLDDTDFWNFITKVYSSEKKPAQSDLDAIMAGCRGKRARSEKDAHEVVQREIEVGKKYGVEITPTYILLIHGKAVEVATSSNLAKVLNERQFADIIEPIAKKQKAEGR